MRQAAVSSPKQSRGQDTEVVTLTSKIEMGEIQSDANKSVTALHKLQLKMGEFGLFDFSKLIEVPIF